MDIAEARMLWAAPIAGCHTTSTLRRALPPDGEPDITDGRPAAYQPKRGGGLRAGNLQEVKRDPGPVVAHGGARIGVAGGLLYVAQRHSGIQSDAVMNNMSKGMRTDSLGDAGSAGGATLLVMAGVPAGW
jgi:hypothetical protein